jgi:hypothetical protein
MELEAKILTMASFKGGENSTDPRRCTAHSNRTRIAADIRWRDELCGLDLEGSGEVISPDAASLEIDPEPTPILTHV